MKKSIKLLIALAMLSLTAACGKEADTGTTVTYGDASPLTELLIGQWACDYCQWTTDGDADSLLAAFVPDSAYTQPLINMPALDSATGLYSWQNDQLLLGPAMQAELNGAKGHWLAVDSTLHLGFGSTYTLQLVEATGSDFKALRRRSEGTAALHWRRIDN